MPLTDDHYALYAKVLEDEAKQRQTFFESVSKKALQKVEQMTLIIEPNPEDPEKDKAESSDEISMEDPS